MWWWSCCCFCGLQKNKILRIASAALMMKKTLLLLKNPWQLLSLAPHNPRASQIDPMKFPLKRPTQMQSLCLTTTTCGFVGGTVPG
jgi:hypothetical protein